MKKVTLTIVMTAILGVAAYTMAGAQAPGRGAGWGPGAEGRFGGGPGGGALLMLRGLELTEQQREQLRKLRGAQTDGVKAVPAERQLHRQLQTELIADNPDPNTLAELQRQIAEAHAARLARQVELGQQMAQVLTPEQRATVRERLAQAPERRGPGARAVRKPAAQ